MIGLTGFDTIPSIPEPTLSFSMICRALDSGGDAQASSNSPSVGTKRSADDATVGFI